MITLDRYGRTGALLITFALAFAFTTLLQGCKVSTNEPSTQPETGNDPKMLWEVGDTAAWEFRDSMARVCVYVEANGIKERSGALDCGYPPDWGKPPTTYESLKPE
jgi:hypothetical protein